MKVKILRKHGMDLLLEGDDIFVDVSISSILLIKHNTYTTGHKRPTTLIIPWNEISELTIFEHSGKVPELSDGTKW